MRKLILIYCYCFTQLIFSQNSENKCFSCEYEFKEFYYIRMNYVDDFGIVFMSGLTEKEDIILKNDSKSFLVDFYDNGYYTPNLFFTYKRVAKYCGDLFFNMLDDYKSYYTKELFFNEQVSDKTMIKNVKMKNGSNIQLNISKIKGVFFIIDKNNEDLDFTMSEELDIYEMDNIQKIYVPYDIVVEDVSEIKLKINNG